MTQPLLWANRLPPRSQVTSQLQEFLNHFPPESKEKAFEQIYKILQMLDAYLIDNPQQH